MTNERKTEIIAKLNQIIIDYVPKDYENQNIDMQGLISRYNKDYDNHELIGGQWVEENTDIELPQ